MELNKGIFVNLLSSKYSIPCPPCRVKTHFFLADEINHQTQLSDYVFCQFIFLSHIEPKMVRRKF